MSDRRKIREMLKMLIIDPDLDQELDSFRYSDEYGIPQTIFVRDCTPLGAGQLVSYAWDLFQASRGGSQKESCERLIWVIGTDDSPTTSWTDGPTADEREALPEFGFWLSESRKTGCLKMSGNLYHKGGRVGTVGRIVAVRVAPRKYRASFSFYSSLKDLKEMYWREMKTIGWP